MKFLFVVFAGALALSTFSVAPPAAEAAPRHGHGHGHDHDRGDRHSKLQFVGYRVLVTPEIQETPRGRLQTHALLWKLRAVYTTAAGHEILASPRPSKRGGAHVRDSHVRVKRAWERSDYPRESRLIVKYRRALRRFNGLKNSSDITLLNDAVEVPVVRPAPVEVYPEPVVVVAPPHPHIPVPLHPPVYRGPSCSKVLLEKGHHPNHLDNCDGVPDRCAVAVLRAGHHPNHLSNCKSANPWCAEKVLAAGHHPNHLDECTVGLSPRCVEALLAKGHHPNHLDNCAGVADACAVQVLNAGHHPNHLSSCK